MKFKFLLLKVAFASTSIVSFWDQLEVYNGTDVVATQILYSDSQIENFESNFTVSGFICQPNDFNDFYEKCQSKIPDEAWIVYN